MLASNRRLRAIGFDDAPFPRRWADQVRPGSSGSDRNGSERVALSGIVTSRTRFEGMLWGHATRDGRDGTEAIAGMLAGSKFLAQLHLILTDGVTVGGLNVLDLPALHARFGIPVVACMRRAPDLARFERTLHTQADGAERWEIVRRAGPIHEVGGFVFQVVGAEPEPTARALAQLTDRGRVPEPLRLAHLIGAAVMTGESGKRA